MDFMKKLFAPVDMTEGTPWKKIVIFMFPMLIGNIAQQLYTTVDTIVVGKYVGDNAISAVGSAGPLLNLLLVLFVGISMGGTIMVSQYFGAKDKESLSYSIGNCIILILISTIIIMIVAPIISEPALRLLKTPEHIIGDTVSYLFITCMGIAGMAYYNILSAILRGLGDSVSALYYLLIASGINIVLDIVFVANFGMGVNGVALATVIAQTISAILCVRKLSKMSDLFDLKLKYLKLSKKFSGTMIRLGLPSGVTQAIVAVSMIIVQPLTNSFGDVVIAASIVIMRVDGFAMMPNFSFGNAMTTYSGQNIGAGKLDRVKRGTKDGLVIGVLTSTTLTILILVFGENILHMFTDTQQVVDVGVSIFKILAVGYIAVSVTQVLQGVMRGSGDTMTPMIISLVAIVGLRLPLLYTLIHISKSDALPNGNYNMIFISLLTVWVFGAIVSALVYRVGKWQRKAIIVSKSKADGVN